MLVDEQLQFFCRVGDRLAPLSEPHQTTFFIKRGLGDDVLWWALFTAVRMLNTRSRSTREGSSSRSMMFFARRCSSSFGNRGGIEARG